MDKYILLARAKQRRAWMEEFNRLGKVSLVCRYLGISRTTFYKWHRRYLASGGKLEGLMELSRRPHSHPNQTTGELQGQIIALRKKTNLGPKRLAWELARQGLKVGSYRIYRVLGRAGLLERRERRRRRKPKVYQVLYPGQKVQVDTKYLPLIRDRRCPEGIKEYQYTAIDCCSRLRYTRIYYELSPQNSVDFVKRMLRFFPFPIEVVQTDHGSEFTYCFFPHVRKAHPFEELLKGEGIIHKLIPLGAKEWNGKVERSHRTDDEELYKARNFRKCRVRQEVARRYLRYYNERRPHSALGNLTPLEKLRTFPQYQAVNLVCY